MTGWLNNLLEYEKNKKSGSCPYCNSQDVEVIEMNHGRRSVSFRCRSCKKGDHFDGILKEK